MKKICNHSEAMTAAGHWAFVPCRRGSVAVEFAMIAPLLVLILTAIIEIGLATAAWFTVQESALAGVNYAGHNGWDAEGISFAVTSAAPNMGVTATLSPGPYCGCPVGTGLNTVGAVCGALCGGSINRSYVDVSASMDRPSVIGVSFGLPQKITVTLTAKIP